MQQAANKHGGLTFSAQLALTDSNTKEVSLDDPQNPPSPLPRKKKRVFDLVTQFKNSQKCE